MTLLGLLAGARGWLEWTARDLEDRARRAWRDVPVTPREPRAAPNDAALALEDEARSIGLEVAPRGGPRDEAGRPAACLPMVHDSLLAMALQGKLLADVSPVVSAWLREKQADVARLADGVARRPAPLWESPSGGLVTRVPPPGERADRLVTEAGRIERPGSDLEPLSDEDEHLVRPGVPRLTSLVLLEEILLIDALERGRADDRAGATRSLRAFERILEGLLADGPDAVRLGVAMHLARLHAAVLRQLPFDEWPPGVLDARFRELALDAIDEEARRLESARAEGRGPAAVVAFALAPLGRCSAARERLALAALRESLRADPCDVGSRLAWVRATSAAPWWDPAAEAHLGDLADLPRRAALADIERELTRTVVRMRAEGLADARGSCPDWRFERGGSPDAPRLRYDGPAPAIERAMPFALPLEASP